MLLIERAGSADAAEIAALRIAVAEALTAAHGKGHWSGHPGGKSVLRAIEAWHVLVAREDGDLVGTLCLSSRKPWAIDPSYFTPVRRPLYLIDMAVSPPRQRQGIGRQLIREAKAVATARPADALWLDCYDGPAGAEGFYARSGFREVGRKAYRGTPLVYFEWLR